MTREFCRDCASLVSGCKGEWVCDECQMPIENVNECPEEMIKITIQEICGCKSCVPEHCKECICYKCGKKDSCLGCDCDICEDGDMEVFCCNQFKEAAKYEK